MDQSSPTHQNNKLSHFCQGTSPHPTRIQRDARNTPPYGFVHDCLRRQYFGRVAVAVIGGFVAFVLATLSPSIHAQNTNGALYVQCPGDTDGDAVPEGKTYDPNRAGYIQDQGRQPTPKCMHLAAGDGFIAMGDGKELYTFGFTDVTGKQPADVMATGNLAAHFPAPTIRLKEDQEFFLNLTNVGMAMRPDLFDAHSVHFHGFPQAASVFDGVPEASATINMGSTFTYYYKIPQGLAGTYMYHCHVEATEHMQMGMLGSLYVEPRQNRTGYGNNSATIAQLEGGNGPLGYAYNDGDGSTAYDAEKAIQIGSMDPNFHDQHISVQPLPFAAMKDTYPMLNGRGYPDTTTATIAPGHEPGSNGGINSQEEDSIIKVDAGKRLLLRISNLAVTRFYTLASTLPMQVVGHNARQLRGPTGTNLYYNTNSVTVGGGESYDVIITAPATVGDYQLYTTNLNYLSNNQQDLGGMMTVIHVN